MTDVMPMRPAPDPASSGGPAAPRCPDAGFSLVEMMVALALSSVLVVMLGSVTMTVLRSARYATTKTQATAQTRTVTERMSRMLRLAVVPAGLTSAFTRADPDGVTFYASIKTDISPTDPVPVLVDYSWNATSKCLNEKVVPGVTILPVPPSGPLYSWTGSGTTRCVVRLASDPTGSTQLLRYFTSPQLNSDGTAPTAMTAPNTGLALIRSVEITLSVTFPDTTDIPSVSSDTKISLDNLVLSGGGRA